MVWETYVVLNRDLVKRVQELLVRILVSQKLPELIHTRVQILKKTRYESGKEKDQVQKPIPFIYVISQRASETKLSEQVIIYGLVWNDPKYIKKVTRKSSY